MTKLIKNPDYLLLVDTEVKPSKGEKFVVMYNDESYLEILENPLDDFREYADEDFTDECFKIIAASPKLEGVPLLPEFCLERVCSNPECGSRFKWKEGQRIIATQCINCFAPLKLPKQRKVESPIGFEPEWEFFPIYEKGYEGHPEYHLRDDADLKIVDGVLQGTYKF